MKSRKKLNKTRARRQSRTRNKIKGATERPRLSVFRSHRYIYAQLIDDKEGKTLVSSSSREIGKKVKKTELSKEVGRLLGEKAVKKNIKKVVFDRGAYSFHGRVKALAEGAREAGLQF